MLVFHILPTPVFSMSSVVLINTGARNPRVLSGLTGALGILCAVLLIAAVVKPEVIVLSDRVELGLFGW